MARPSQHFKRYLRYSTVGLEMGFSVLIGLFIGQYLDRVLGTEPWLLLVFLLLGAAAGFRRLYQLLREAVSDTQHPESDEEDDER